MVVIQKFVYVNLIVCSDSSIYTGVTKDLKQRYFEHENGLSKSSYTFSRRPFQCLHWEVYDSPMGAILREKQIKRWTRKKKMALIEGRMSDLKMMSRKM
jgi:putative endonuclease